MRLTAFIAPLLLAGVHATYNCLTYEEAKSIADRSAIFLSHLDVTLANTTAQGLFAEDIVEFGDSINSLRGDPLGTQVENGRDSYIADTLSAPPIPSIVTLDIIKDCTSMVWQWQFNGIGSGEYRVQGMTIIKVNQYKLVNYQYVEFNSLAWGIDIGFNVTVPPGLFGKK